MCIVYGDLLGYVGNEVVVCYFHAFWEASGSRGVV